MKTTPTHLRRLGAGAATGALVASGLLLVGSPAQAAETVTSADIAPDESTYAGWHQGYDNARYASGISSKGLSSIGRSQILNGYTDNDNADLDANGVNADLSDDLVGARYDVVNGEAYFQVALFADLDGTAGPNESVFTTLRPAVPATGNTQVNGTETWVSSKPLGSIPANTPTPLSSIIDKIEGGTYKTIGFGVLTDVGKTSTVKSITFDGETYEFAADAVGSATVKDSQVAGEETSNNYKTWHQGYADATGRQQVTAKGLELAGKSQVLKGSNNTSENLTTANVNLAGAIPDASYTVDEGKAYFQIALRFDNGDGVKFATLRNDGTGGALSLDDTWQSSRAINADIPANTGVKLSTIIAALGNYKVIGYGVLTTAGETAVVSRITFGATTTTFEDQPQASTTSKVLPGQLAGDESTYAGWHQGGTPATPARIANGVLDLGPDRSQVIKGYANNSKDTSTDNVDLASALRSGSYTVKSGDVFFQVPLFFEDANGATQFATLRPAVKAQVGTNTFSIRDQWVSSKQLGDLPANQPALLGDILSSVPTYKVLAFGVYSDAGGNGVVTDITWDGVKHSFAKATSTTDFTRTNPTKPSSKKRFYVYATVTAEAGAPSVQGGLVTVTNGGKSWGKGRLNEQGKVKILLSRKMAKGNRTITMKYSGTDQIAPSSESLKVRIK